MGSGTTAIAAIRSDRKFIGYDISKEYIKLAEKRTQPYLQQIVINFNLSKENKEKANNINSIPALGIKPDSSIPLGTAEDTNNYNA